jgi:hypothetical protein
MTAPNILSVTSILGKTAVQAVGTSATAFLTNATNSNKVLKLTSLYVSNVNGTVAADVTIDLFRSTVAYEIASTVSVPPDATIVVVNKESPIYIEEGDSLRSLGSLTGALKIVCSYEEISS